LTTAPRSPDSSQARHSPWKYGFFTVITVVWVIADQWTKIWVRSNLRLYKDEIQVIDGFFSLIHAENPGAAFGLGAGSPYAMAIFGVFTVVAMFVLLKMLSELPANDRFQNAALALITSGAIGNAIDRVDKQKVTDFLRVYTNHPSAQAKLEAWFGTSEWPAFNVADAAIVIGLGMFGIFYLFLQKDQEGLEPDPPSKALADGAPTDGPEGRSAEKGDGPA
jgi:signal peptidase II